MTRVAVLTPAGTGAIATVAVVGPGAWAAVRERFRPAGGKPLPDGPPAGRFWYGALGDGPGDEVVVAVKEVDPDPWVEVHCHGGRQVVRWLVGQFVASGCVETSWQGLPLKPAHCNGRACDVRALEPLTKAPTLRTASILLDQYHGAFAGAVAAVLAALDGGDRGAAAAGLHELHRFADVGRHLVAPWTVAVAGPPNVGKSSLVNALAGYQRSIVAPVAGTTRDLVTVTTALDGWPVELVDTAGQRAAADPVEAEGVERARRLLDRGTDSYVWVVDGSAPGPDWGAGGRVPVVAVNKTDLPAGWDWAVVPHAVKVSAATGAGVPELAAAILDSMVIRTPPPGAAVPFTPELAAAVDRALWALVGGDAGAARETLAACLPG